MHSTKGSLATALSNIFFNIGTLSRTEWFAHYSDEERLLNVRDEGDKGWETHSYPYIYRVIG